VLLARRSGRLHWRAVPRRDSPATIQAGGATRLQAQAQKLSKVFKGEMSRIYRFGDYELDGQRRVLTHQSAPVPVTARALDILLVLVQERRRVVEKEELLSRVWPDQIVEEGNLSQQIFVLRRLLGGADFIATVPRRGYQFVAPVDEIAVGSSRGAVAPAVRLLRLTVALDPPLVLGPNPAFAVARDSSVLVYVGEHAGSTALFVRRLDAYETRLIAGTSGAAAPFLSPDGRWVGYTAGGRLQRVGIDGGLPLSIADVDGAGRGATWGPDNLIVFAPVPAGPLFVVAAAGGTPRPLTRLAYADGERSHRFPSFTPDRRYVLFTIARAGDASFDEARLAVAAVESGTHQVVLAGGSCGIVAGPRLHYQRGGMLFVTDFDPSRRARADAGDPQEAIAVHEAGAAHVAVADSGLIVYAPPLPPVAPARLVWHHHDGREEMVDDLPGVPEEPRISPDGSRIVMGLRAETSDLWLYDLHRRTLTRLTDSGDNFAAVWTPDGSALVFSSNRHGPSNLYRLPIGAPDGTVPVAESASEQVPATWTPDGAALLFTQYDADTGAELWRLNAGGVEPVMMRTRFNDYAPALSHDGRWLAYTSDASGAPEIYLVRYPELIDRRQLSRAGGSEPVWAPNRMRLYFRSPSSFVAVDVDEAENVSDAVEVASDRYVRGSITSLPNYDVHADGRLLIVTRPEIRTTRESLNAVVPFLPHD
jgi:Tol biopolymer transport system component/DNA-binding winged helix-turn-helix (wHTH) protein